MRARGARKGRLGGSPPAVDLLPRTPADPPRIDDKTTSDRTDLASRQPAPTQRFSCGSAAFDFLNMSTEFLISPVVMDGFCGFFAPHFPTRHAFPVTTEKFRTTLRKMWCGQKDIPDIAKWCADHPQD